MLLSSNFQSLGLLTDLTSELTWQAEPFNLVLSSTATQSSLSGALNSWDDFNPTRFGTYKDDYQLDATNGGTFEINLASNDFDAYLQLIDFNTGQVLAENDDNAVGADSQLNFVTQSGRQYIIRVTSFDSYATGSYTISAVQLSTPAPAPSSNTFNSTFGYGLVDGASAVAQAISAPRFAEVADLGGTNWSNDLVNAPEVWARGFSGQGVVVAVIDSGVDITHPDLRNNIWVNSREVANDGLDNDGNGYADDLFGWNFGQGQFNNNVLPGTNDPGQGHGTHVAGTIAAAWNDFGITGVAPNARIMSLRLGDASGNRIVNAGNLSLAIRYAVDNGARVINMSLGWEDSPELVDALRYAAARNVITISSAGNEALPTPGAPASYATQFGISVGAIDRFGGIASFSNRAGSNPMLRHVVAPGVAIVSTLPNGEYGSMNGTSMAAPHVAGVVALMLSANPNLTAEQVRQILTGTSKDTTRATSGLSAVSCSFSLNAMQFPTPDWSTDPISEDES